MENRLWSGGVDLKWRLGRRDHLASDKRAGTFARRKARTTQRAYLRDNWWRLTLVYAAMTAVAVTPTVLLLDGGMVKGFALGVAVTGVAAALLLLVVVQSGTGPTMAGELAEQWTAQALRPLETDGFRLINHVMVDDRGDLDHVLIGPHGCFLIETKWSASPWDLDNNYLRQAVRRMHGKARTVRRQLGGLSDGAVVPVIVLWGQAARAARQGTGVHKLEGFDTYVLTGDHLPRWLRGRRRDVLTPAEAQLAYQHFVALAEAGDLTEDPVPPSVERLFWSSVGVIFAGLAGFLLPLYLLSLHLALAMAASLGLAGVGLAVRRRNQTLGTAIATGALLSLLLLTVAFMVQPAAQESSATRSTAIAPQGASRPSVRR